MEIAKLEVAAVEKVIADKSMAQMSELVELELALVGGGVGDIILG